MTIFIAGTLILIALAIPCVVHEYRERRAARRAAEDEAVGDILAEMDGDEGGYF